MGDLTRGLRALALVAALAAAGCSKVSNGVAPVGAGEPGVVRIVGFGGIDSLVPELSASAASVDVGQFWGAWLFLVNDRGDLEPDLATEVPTYQNGGVSRDGLTLTYHLRRGVTWHDGAPFDARDVIFTWHAIMNPRNNVLTREGYDDIVSMTAPDPYTVRVLLAHPYSPAVATFFGPSLEPMCILPAHLLGDLPDINHASYDNKPIGTGPFEITDYEPGTKIVLMPNPHYWRGPPKLREVDFLMASDPNTQALMVRTGEADLYYDPPAALLPQLRSAPGVHTGDLTFDEFWYLTINEKHPPLDDVRVRRAIAEVVDRNFLVNRILQGVAIPATTDQPPFSWAFDPDVHEPPYDPVDAGRLLDAAGWLRGPDGVREKDGRSLSLVVSTSINWSDAKRFAVVFQQAMKQIGAAVSIKTYPTAVLEGSAGSGGVINTGRFDLVIEGWLAGVDPDDSALWLCDQQPPNGYNHAYSCDPRIDAQEAIALTSYDRGVRKAAYGRIQELLAEDVPVVFLYYSKRDDAIRDDLGDYRPAPAVTEFWNTWQWTMR
jgi:peptide/nickel transport system substrate-binding protein